MKSPILIICTLLLSISCDQHPKVYICKSRASYAYHNRECQGLRKCTHKIDTVTLTDAVKIWKRRACGYCYK